jgi:hypothetical protein
MSFLDSIKSQRGTRPVPPPPAGTTPQVGPGDVVLYEPWGALDDRAKPSKFEARAEGLRVAAELLRRQQETDE